MVLRILNRIGIRKNGRRGGSRDQARLEQRLREELHRYEADLRELANK